MSTKLQKYPAGTLAQTNLKKATAHSK